MYRIFDFGLDSDLHFPELPEIDGSDNPIKIRVLRQEKAIPANPSWFHHWKDMAGNTLMSCAKLQSVYLLRFIGVADFLISHDTKSIHYSSRPNVQVETIQALLVDQVIPYMLGQSGCLILHASAVQVAPESAVLFVGESGWGKSTLASQFKVLGADLLTDDTVLIEIENEIPLMLPGHGDVKLFEDSLRAVFEHEDCRLHVPNYSGKTRVRISGQGNFGLKKPCPVAALFILGDPCDQAVTKEVSIEHAKSRDVMRLVRSSFLLDPTNKQLVAEKFLQVAELTRVVDHVRVLRYPRSYQMLPAVAGSVVDFLGEFGSPLSKNLASQNGE